MKPNPSSAELAELYRIRPPAEAATSFRTNLYTLKRRRRQGNGMRYVRINPTDVGFHLIEYQAQHLVIQEVAHG
jgi:hypothetical protein